MNILDMPGHLVRRMHQRSTQVFNAQVRSAGLDLTSVQFAAMDAMRARPGIDQAGVALAIAYDRATIGGVVERLVQKGYVARRIDPRDRRARVLELTRSGHDEYDRAVLIVTALQDRIFSGLTRAERRTLIALLAKATADPLPDDAKCPAAFPGRT